MSYSLEDELRIRPQLEILDSLDAVVESNLDLLSPIDKAWQPSDYLPNFAQPDWLEQLSTLRQSASSLSDEVLVVLVGDMVTEEALPNYAIALNGLARDQQGNSPSPWARWMRGWIAEENRHGDLLNAYLRLTGRVDMRAVEATVHHLLVGGFNPKTHPDPYAGLVYTSFQERATKISHMRVGQLAGKNGDATLAKICGKIAGDEAHHEKFYTRMMGEIMAQDPTGGVLVFRNMLRRIITMPGMQMNDPSAPDLFTNFSRVAQRLGVYTAHDYADIIRHLVKTWKIADLSLTGKAAAAQNFLCVQAERIGALAEEVTAQAINQPCTGFTWIHGRTA